MTDEPRGPLAMVDEATGAVRVIIPDEHGHLDVPAGRWTPLPTTRVVFAGGPADGLEADAHALPGSNTPPMVLYVSVVRGLAVPLAGPAHAAEFTAELRARRHDLYASEPQWKVRHPGDDTPRQYNWQSPAQVQPDPPS